MTEKSGHEFVPSLPRAGLFRRARRAALGWVPVAVWAGGVAGIVFLAAQRAVPLEYPGIGIVAEVTVTASANGHVESLVVDPLSSVDAGQIVGRLEGSQLELLTRQIGHRIRELRSQVLRERELHDQNRARAQQDQDNEVRRFLRDVENARLNSLEVLARLEESRIRLEGLRFDLVRQKALAVQGLFSEAELIRTQTDFDALEERMRQTEEILRGRRLKEEAVEARLADYEARKRVDSADIERVVGPFEWRIAAEETELEMVALRRTRLAIRAPIAGLVSKTHARAGEFISAGDPVFTVTRRTADRIVAYVPAEEISRVRPGMVAVLERVSPGGGAARAALVRTKVSELGPAVRELPVQLLSSPNVRQWGVPVYLEATPELVVLPGESVRVKILSDVAPD